MSLEISSGHLYVKFGRKFVPVEGTVEQFDALLADRDRLSAELERVKRNHLRRTVKYSKVMNAWGSSLLTRIAQGEQGATAEKIQRLVRFTEKYHDFSVKAKSALAKMEERRL